MSGSALMSEGAFAGVASGAAPHKPPARTTAAAHTPRSFGFITGPQTKMTRSSFTIVNAIMQAASPGSSQKSP